MSKRLNRTVYNVATIDQTGQVDIIRRKYNSIYSRFTKELPEADKLLNAHVRSYDFEYIPDNNLMIPEIQNVVNRYPKKATGLAMMKPTAIKDLDSIDAKYRGNAENYDICINKDELFQIIKKNIAKGIEAMSIDLGNKITFELEYQLKTNTKAFVEDVADIVARSESGTSLSASAVIALAVQVQNILDHKEEKNVELVENKHRWGTNYSAIIGKLNIPLSGNYGGELKRKHPLIKLVQFSEVED
jgi:hypothetical protein